MTDAGDMRWIYECVEGGARKIAGRMRVKSAQVQADIKFVSARKLRHRPRHNLRARG
jgi:hypothetical protein